MDYYRLRQIESITELGEYLEQNSRAPYMAWDLETRSLDNRPENVCGHCISFESTEAVYIPTQHVNYPDKNLDHSIVWDMIGKAVEQRPVLVYNWMFEGRVARLQGWDRPASLAMVKDVMVYRWLFDSDKKQFNLKDASKDLIGMEMLEIQEVPGILTGKGKKDLNFSLSDPSDATLYAAADPLTTLLIYKKIGPIVEKEQPIVLNLEHTLLDVLLDMENNPITIDRGYLRQAKNELEHWITVVAKRIYRLAGREFNIGSPAEVGKMLKDMKVPIKTNEKTGNAKTGADEIEELAKEHPICEGILLWRSLIKEKSTYVEALLDCTSEEKPNAVFKFRSVGAPTGRFASGGVDPGDPIYAPMNVQSIPSSSAYRKTRIWLIKNPPPELEV
jgi:DNA polymerase-1